MVLPVDVKRRLPEEKKEAEEGKGDEDGPESDTRAHPGPLARDFPRMWPARWLYAHLEAPQASVVANAQQVVALRHLSPSLADRLHLMIAIASGNRNPFYPSAASIPFSPNCREIETRW
jgi:hypothetical protein